VSGIMTKSSTGRINYKSVTTLSSTSSSSSSAAVEPKITKVVATNYPYHRHYYHHRTRNMLHSYLILLSLSLFILYSMLFNSVCAFTLPSLSPLSSNKLKPLSKLSSLTWINSPLSSTITTTIASTTTTTTTSIAAVISSDESTLTSNNNESKETCRHCRTSFIIRSNKDNSCIRHSGTIRGESIRKGNWETYNNLSPSSSITTTDNNGDINSHDSNGGVEDDLVYTWTCCGGNRNDLGCVSSKHESYS